jgi:dimethylamine--corrinoid protein Co-methyltransferase
MGKLFSRMGDGSPVELTEAELVQELEEGTADAAERGRIGPLTKEEMQYLFEVFSCPFRFVSVEPGNEVILTYDGPTLKMERAAVAVNRIQSLQIYEKLLGADTLELAHTDYSYKPIKPIVGMEQPQVEQAILITTPPLYTGAMPNLGLYSQPDGPFPNPAELMPLGKIDEARASYEQAVEAAVKDIVYVSSSMYEAGVDGTNLDTVGAAGDADFLAGLKAAEVLRQKFPDMCIEMGMAGEFVLGLHGDLHYKGVRLAGLYPHQQVQLAEKAGVTIFGPVVNTSTSRTIPWNLSRALTFVKACCEAAAIPVHVNMGMGVGAVTVNDHPPIDVVSRASKAMVEICRLDGL